MSFPLGDFSPESPDPAPGNPDLAFNVYQKLGLDNPNVTVKGYRSLMQDLKPGDLVGWVGGQEPDGRYVGNIAVWAGNGEIIENVFGRNRRRKLGKSENTFGIPVNLDDDEPTDPGDMTPEENHVSID